MVKQIISPIKHQQPSPLNPLQQSLKEELQQCLLFDNPDERQFWLDNLQTIPSPIIENLLKALLPKNTLVNSYINKALAQDQNQEHLKSFQIKIKHLKQQAFAIEEQVDIKLENQSGDQLLDQLKQL